MDVRIARVDGISGQRPETFIGKYGPYLLPPEMIPDAGVDVDDGFRLVSILVDE